MDSTTVRDGSNSRPGSFSDRDDSLLWDGSMPRAPRNSGALPSPCIVVATRHVSLPGLRMLSAITRAAETPQELSRFELEVIQGEWAAALLMIIVTLVPYTRSVPFPQGAPAQSAGCTGHSDQIESPRRMRLVS